ncbi:MAG: pyridine nucleotide-disulfide oxidoreductase, partial [Arenimonas sp.]|nr:pyridine nucleotide-disulfide oxidoreductase [Arenimonas sp.]
RQAVRALRRATAERLARGEDWRDVVGALRAHTPSIWQSWSMADRARFLRHVRPHWEVLRHRCAPDAHDAFTALQRQGRLELLAARLRGVQPVDDGLLVQLARRGGAATEQRRAQVVINPRNGSTRI